MSKLVGFKRFKSKKGTDCCVANILTEFSATDNARGYYGSDVQSVFLPENQIDALTAKDIGKEVSLSYNIVNGRAYLQELSVK